MAVSHAVAIRWIPEDDLLLKNAVEGGASLEALAKGAIQFSRRFTLRELRDRWHTLLYDPDISDQSSIQMFGLEISGFNPSLKFLKSENNLKGNKEIPPKRKAESIRRKYYAMRKKIRSEIFSNSDLVLFEPDPHDFCAHGAEFQKQITIDDRMVGQTCILRDSTSDNLRFQEDLNILRHAFPETVGDVAVNSATTYVSQTTTYVSQTGCPTSFGTGCTNGIIECSGFDENACGGNNMLEENVENRKNPVTLENCSSSNAFTGFEDLQFKPCNSDGYSFPKTTYGSGKSHLRHLRVQDILAPTITVVTSLQDTDQVLKDMLPHDVDSQENRSIVYTSEYADPDSLLNFSNEDEIILIDIDETLAEDVLYSNNSSSLVQGSHDNGQPNDIAVVDIEASTVSGTSFTPALSASSVVLEASVSSAYGQELKNFHLGINVSSNLTSNSDVTQLSNGNITTELNNEKICCVLNSEDIEIPCNDDIFLLIHPSTSFGSYASQLDINDSVNAFSTAHENNSERGLNFQSKPMDSKRAYGGPPKVGLNRLSESHVVHPRVGFVAKTEAPESRTNTILSGFPHKANNDSSKAGLLYTIPKTPNDWSIEKDVTGVAMKVGGNPATVTEMLEAKQTSSGRMVLPELALDASGSDLDESLIDAGVPYFSDIEAMILEMDLDPYEQDTLTTRQASSYMCDDTKRTIIRLEQGVRSCLQREMTIEGALAILYGRHLRHYIRKPEVVLGRSTDDVDVDIDLRKEGWANKISRRQAIIKMESDGSFLLKNLGKSLMSVNGMTVSTGQILTLSSSCLIEIRGMSFVFEINERFVKQYLLNLDRKLKKGTVKSDRFP